MSVAIIIPARIGSTRLPRKALIPINGKPMISHVFEKAIQSGLGDVFVATDDDEIQNTVKNIGGKVIMTHPYLASGTDRIYEAYQKISMKYDIVINLQGDMPDVKPVIIEGVIEILRKIPDCDIATSVFEIVNKEDIQNPNIVKAILSYNNFSNFHRAIYFTRASAPSNPDQDTNAKYFGHLGIYGYRPESLDKFINLPVSYLEKREKLEQLRAIESDMKIFANLIQNSDIPTSVDVVDDLKKFTNGI